MARWAFPPDASVEPTDHVGADDPHGLAGRNLQGVDIGAPGTTAGDSYVFAGPLYDRTDTERIGFLSGNCVFAAPNFHSLATCTVTATPHLEGPSPGFGDQITLQGWNDDTPYPFKQAITGGTGIYQNVRGDALAEPGDPFRITFRLLP